MHRTALFRGKGNCIYFLTPNPQARRLNRVVCAIFAGFCACSPAFALTPWSPDGSSLQLPADSFVSPLSDGRFDWKAFAPYAQSDPASNRTSLPAFASHADASISPTSPGFDFGTGRLESDPAPSTLDETRPIDWRTILPDLAHDQRAIWTFPTRLAHGEDWKPTLAFVVVLGALIALDSHDTSYFHRTTAYSGFNNYFTGFNTAVGALLVPPAFYAVGKLRKDSYATQTALLAGESILDSEALATVLKFATARRRPYEIPTGGNYADTWFENYHPIPNFHGSFPSGHAVLVFSVATVIAQRYGKHRWVPFVAYGAASLVCFSRLTQQAHFPSDVFAGAAFGYVISRYVVLPGRNPGD